MTPHIRKGITTGLIYGVVVIFLFLIGIATVLKHDTDNILLLLGLAGIVAGSSAAKAPTKADQGMGAVLVRGLLAGMVAGLLSGLATYVIASINQTGANMRTYMAQLSPEAAVAIALEQSPFVGALAHLGVLTGSGLMGAGLRWMISYTGLGQLVSGQWRSSSAQFTTLPAVKATISSRVTRYIIYGLLIVAALILPQELNPQLRFAMGTVGIYAMMGLGLNIVVGLAGLLDLGYVVFFALGAYTVGLLTAPIPHHLEWNFWATIPVAILITVMFGILLGVPVLRLRGDYLAIVTLGFGEIIAVLIRSDALKPFSNGANGLPGIKLPTMPDLPALPDWLGGAITPEEKFLYLILIGVMAAIFISDRLQHSRVGRAWIAIREDETVAQAMGINTLYYKLLAFGLGGALAGMGGVLFASRNQFVGPESMTLIVSINILSLVIVGGMGSIPGVILGAFVLKGIPELLRELESYRFLAFGALLVVMMILRPQGLWPSARRRLEMHLEEEPPLDELETVPSGEAAR